MPVQSTNNVLVPLQSSAEGETYFALFNTLAGSIDVIDQRIARGLEPLAAGRTPGFVPLGSLRRQAGCDLSPTVMTYLSNRGYLFESRQEELQQSQLLYREMMRFHRQTVGQPIVVIPSYNCDLKCPYCWQRLYHMDSPIISEERVDHLFEVMPQFVETKPENVTLTLFGGEPLQNIPELQQRIVQILDHGRAMGFNAGVITNGVGLKAAVPLIAGKVDVIQMTFDGPADIHRKRRPLPLKKDSFTPAVEGVTAALAAGIRVRVRVNTDATNLERLPELAEFAEAQGWFETGKIHFHLAPVKNHNPRKKTNPESELLLKVLDFAARDERMKRFDLSGFAGLKYFNGFKESGLFSLHRFFNCEAQINCWVFDLHGDVYACWDSAGIRDMAVGKYAPEVEIETDKLGLWRDRNALDIDTCDGCASAPHCGGGCQFLAYEHGGKFDSSCCDSLMEGYVQAIESHTDWLLERAHKGDHAVGLVAGGEVRHAVNRPFGLLEDPADLLDHQIGCG